MPMANETKQKGARLFIGLAFAFCGATIASLIGLPAPALVGATLATTICALAKLKPEIPNWLRNIGFAVIGGTLGSGVTPTFFSDIARFPLSLLGLSISMALTILISGYALMRFFGLSRNSAVLATSPGALSYSLALATGGVGDLRSIMVLQSIRLLLITLVLPPVLASLGGAMGGEAHHDGVLGLYASIIILLFAAALGTALDRFSVPAAWLLAGLAVSGLAHGLGLVSGRFDGPVTFAGFTIAGAVIGARFSGISWAEMKRFIVAGIMATGLAVMVSAVAAYSVAALLGLPFPQVWIAFAPGGVEGMSAMALALDFDPIFVATHHIFRILTLIAILPFLIVDKNADQS